MGRNSKYDELRLNAEKIKSDWEKVGSTKGLAKLWDVSEYSVRNYIKRAGLSYKDFYVKRPRRASSAFAKWLRENKEPLPRDMKAISVKSGCSYDTVKSYFYREQDSRYRVWEEFLRTWLPTQKTFSGISREDVKSITFMVDRYTFKCILKITQKNGDVRSFKLPDSLLKGGASGLEQNV